jgi:hypothetical protein
LGTAVRGGAAFRAALRSAGSCFGFQQAVPPAPERFNAARLASERTCRAFAALPAIGERWRPGDSTALSDLQLAVVRAETLFDQAEDSVLTSLSSNRPLPARTGLVTRSRVEPRFGAVATALTGHPVTVKCWSASNWPIVEQEENR